MCIYLIAVKLGYLDGLDVLFDISYTCTRVLGIAQLYPALLFKNTESSVFVCGIIWQNYCSTVGDFVCGSIFLGVCADRLNVYTADIYQRAVVYFVPFFEIWLVLIEVEIGRSLNQLEP